MTWTELDDTTQSIVIVWTGVALLGLGYAIAWVRRRLKRPKTRRGLKVRDWIQRGR